MKKLVILVFCLALFAFSGCINHEESSVSALSESTISESITSVPTTEETDIYTIVDAFLEHYGTEKISEVVELDIQGEDYRTEYRLNAFQNAVGKKGIIEGGTIEIINYGVWSNDSIRFYATTDTLDAATALCTDIIHILDSSISDEAISAEFSPLVSGSSTNIYLGSAGYISGDINTDYADGGISGYEIMIDCTKINF